MQFKKIILSSLIFLAACSHETAFQDLHGNTIRLSDYHGKWLFINYWASWCKPCYQEVPELNAFYRTHQNKNVTVIGVNFDQQSTDTKVLLAQKLGIQYPVLSSDPSTQIGLREVNALPLNVLIGPDGKVKKILYGPQTVQSLEKAITDQL